MMKKRLSKKIWYGSDVDNEGNPVLPPLAIDSDDLEGLHYGELYLHIADDKLSLWTRTLTDQVKQIGGSGSGDGELWQLRQTDAGEPYLFSPFDVAVQRGLTSFVDGGSLDLPSIYDGLPIDNQTLYWEEVTEEVGTDEEGNPIYETVKVLKAKGGGGVADSVHWDDIEGKPNFDDYATQDNLKDYLPLSGGTMTGQINMPVGIGNAIKFGEESRLFASNGNFYISAEANLVFASGASGNNVPNNAVIDKTGRMFIANNLVVGRSSFITDSYKLNVDGDAYVNGKLVVSGTIYPSISSFHNIGDPSKRFACVYADSVDVGGVKISLLQDGVLLVDGNLAVTGGITSYVDGGDLDLPSIYDGLPIDGDTLYWVLDDNGKKVMLKSKGGNDEGGGTVQYPLTWSGFSNGSWDGSEAKTIVIPEKLSELDSKDGLTLGGSLNMPSGYSQIKCGENALLESYGGSTDTYLSGNEHLYLVSKNIFAVEGSEEIYRILHEGNYRNYEYTAKWLSVVDIRNTTPKPSDIDTFAVSAQFTNADNPGDGWYSGLSIQGWTNDYKAWQLRSGANTSADNHLYFRNGVLETWNDWRRVITGDVDGVLDFNLEVKGEEGGNIKFVVNPNGCIENGIYELTSIRHALRFPWYDDEYEIGTVRSNTADAWGFGVTYQNNQLVWRVDREQMDVYGDLRLKGGLIQYNEEDGYFYLEGNLVVSGGITSYSSDGKATPFLTNVDKLENITSDSKTQVYTANVVTLLKKQLDTVDTKADASETRISNLKTALEGLSASNVTELVSALKNLNF